MIKMKRLFSKILINTLITTFFISFYSIVFFNSSIDIVGAEFKHEPITKVGSVGGGDFKSFLEESFKWLVTFCAIAAAIMLTIGGIEYMGSESVFKKQSGKDRIAYAIGGLIIALASVIIMNTIVGKSGESGSSFNVPINLGSGGS